MFDLATNTVNGWANDLAIIEIPLRFYIKVNGNNKSLIKSCDSVFLLFETSLPISDVTIISQVMLFWSCRYDGWENFLQLYRKT